MKQITLQEYVDGWMLDNPGHTDLDLFNAGRSFADTDDIFNNIMSWKNVEPIHALIFKLLKHRKISVSVIIEQYTNYLSEINNNKSETIDELSVNLLTYRHKIYTPKDIEEWNVRSDEILKKAGWERNKINK